MGANLARIFGTNSLELIETGSRWIKETRDRCVAGVALWFHMNKEQIWIKFKKNRAVCLAVVVQLAIIIINSFLLGYEGVVPRWKASWIARMSIFAMIFLTFKIFVEIKRFKSTRRENNTTCYWTYEDQNQGIAFSTYVEILYVEDEDLYQVRVPIAAEN